MKLITTIITVMMLLSLIVSSTFAGALPEGLSLRTGGDLPYPVADMVFTGEIGGHQVQFNGSIQEIYAQMKDHHPEFNLDTYLANKNLTARDFPLESRSQSTEYCWPVPGQNWGQANQDRIYDGVNYLYGNPGMCMQPPRSCGRVSCSYNSAIYWCNDNYYEQFALCSYLGYFAAIIAWDCKTGSPNNYWTCGQLFDTDGFNVIVRSDRC